MYVMFFCFFARTVSNSANANRSLVPNIFWLVVVLTEFYVFLGIRIDPLEWQGCPFGFPWSESILRNPQTGLSSKGSPTSPQNLPRVSQFEVRRCGRGAWGVRGHVPVQSHQPCLVRTWLPRFLCSRKGGFKRCLLGPFRVRFL